MEGVMKNHAAGGKITGTHTTVIDHATELVVFLSENILVEKIVLGAITGHTCQGLGNLRVKIVSESCCALLVVTQKGAVQDIRVYPKHGTMQDMKLAIARYIRNDRIELGFRRFRNTSQN